MSEDKYHATSHPIPVPGKEDALVNVALLSKKPKTSVEIAPVLEPSTPPPQDDTQPWVVRVSKSAPIPIIYPEKKEKENLNEGGQYVGSAYRKAYPNGWCI